MSLDPPPTPQERAEAINRLDALRRAGAARRRRRRFGIVAVPAVAVATVAAVLAVVFTGGGGRDQPVDVNPAGPPSQSSGVTAPVTRAPPPHATSTVPPAVAAATESTTLVYAQSGVAVVGVTSGGSGTQGTHPSKLYLSTDMVRWRDVTPPQVAVQTNGTYAWFEHASFLNASVGWVTAWNPGTTYVTFYRTSDGGTTWSAIPGGGHSGNAGATTLIQLVSPTAAFREYLEPTAPSMSLQATTDAGQTWRTVYNGPSATTKSAALSGPFEIPITFADDRLGFGTEGSIPPTDPLGEASQPEFFATRDGGATWTAESPPLPRNGAGCPAEIDGPDSPTTCVYSAPTFAGTDRAVVAGAVFTGTSATINFDDTADSGEHWTQRSQRSVLLDRPPQTGDGLYIVDYPLVALPSTTTWWLINWTTTSMTTQTTTSSGTHWAEATSTWAGQRPTNLQPLDATTAILTTTEASATQLFTTTSNGQSWKPLDLSGSG